MTSSNPVLLIVLGLICALTPVTEYAYARRQNAADKAGVIQLGANLTAAQQKLARITTAADSAPILADIKDRQFYLGQRSYHLPNQQARLDAAWRPTSPTTIITTIGVILVAIGTRQLTRRRNTPSPLAAN